MTLFLQSLINDPTYHALCAVQGLGTEEGNLLERTEGRTAESQIEVIRWAIWRAGMAPSVVAETGTNRAMFGFLLSRIAPMPCVLHTCDPEEASGRCVATLNAMQNRVRGIFHPGTSRDVLPTIASMCPDIAWIDGDHSELGALSDLVTLAEAATPLLMVDDAIGIPDVGRAVARFLAAAPYVQEYPPHPLASGDTRGIAILVRRA